MPEKTKNFSADRSSAPASEPTDTPERSTPVTPPSAAPSNKSTSAAYAPAETRKLSVSAIVGFVLSGLGFLLITVPFGLWLGYRGRSETATDQLEGQPFAKWAIILGWLWVVFWLLALLSYLWILL